jgi:hypothetical protein
MSRFLPPTETRGSQERRRPSLPWRHLEFEAGHLTVRVVPGGRGGDGFVSCFQPASEVVTKMGSSNPLAVGQPGLLTGP